MGEALAGTHNAPSIRAILGREDREAPPQTAPMSSRTGTRESRWGNNGSANKPCARPLLPRSVGSLVDRARGVPEIRRSGQYASTVCYHYICA